MRMHTLLQCIYHVCSLNFYSLQGSGKRQIEVLTIADLQKEYLLVKAKLRLLKKEPALATQLTSMSLTSCSHHSYMYVQCPLCMSCTFPIFHMSTCTCMLALEYTRVWYTCIPVICKFYEYRRTGFDCIINFNDYA